MSSTLELLLDYREKDLISLIKKANQTRLDKVSITTPNLHVGDIIINYKHISKKKEETIYKLIIERKTVSDLMASIKDGRYKEQKMRIHSKKEEDINNGIKCQFLYLIEGNVNTIKFRKKQSNKGVYGSWISMLFRDNIKLIRTWDIEETSIFIMRLIDRILKNAKELWTQYDNNNSLNNNLVNGIKDINGIKKIKLYLDKKNDIVNKNNSIKIIKTDGKSQIENRDTISNIKVDNISNLNNIKPIKLKASLSYNKVNNSGYEIESPMEGEKIEQVNMEISNELEKEYLSTFSIKTKKSDNLTPNTCQKIMLSVIPGMSCGISIQVLEYFGSLSNLLDWLKLDFGKDIKLLCSNSSILRKMKKHHLDVYRIFKDNIIISDFFKEGIITELSYINYLNSLENCKGEDNKLHLDVLKDYLLMMKKKELSELKIKLNVEKKKESKERKLGPSLAEKIITYLC